MNRVRRKVNPSKSCKRKYRNALKFTFKCSFLQTFCVKAGNSNGNLKVNMDSTIFAHEADYLEVSTTNKTRF